MDSANYEERLEALVTQECTSYRTIDYMIERPSRVVTTEFGNPTVACSPCGKKKRRLMTTVVGSHGNKSRPTNTEPSQGSSVTSPTTSAAESRTRKYWREMMCAWAYKVVDHFDLNREIVGIAMHYLDRYMATLRNPMQIDKHLYQLVAMTCLYLAIKLYEFKHIGIPGSCSTMDTIRQLSQGSYTLQQMEQMELDILQRLQWHLHPPTPQVFIDLLVDSDLSEPADLGNFLVELAAMDYFFVSYKPSEIAAAALLNAMDQLYGAFPPLAMSDVTQRLQKFDSSRVQECRQRLGVAYQQLGDTDDSQWQRPACGNASPVTVTATIF